MSISQTEADKDLIVGVMLSNFSEIKKALAAGANPNAGDGEPLKLAAKNGRLDIAKLLLQFGSEINGFSNVYNETAESLMLNNYDPSFFDKMIFLVRAGSVRQKSRIDSAAYEKNSNVWVNETWTGMSCSPGDKPLTVAINENQFEMVKFLIESGAEFCDNESWYAVFKYHRENVLRYFLSLEKGMNFMKEQVSGNNNVLLDKNVVNSPDLLKIILELGFYGLDKVQKGLVNLKDNLEKMVWLSSGNMQGHERSLSVFQAYLNCKLHQELADARKALRAAPEVCESACADAGTFKSSTRI